MRKRWATLFSGLMAMIMIVMAGCSSVGGIDLNQVLMNSLKVQSSEGKMSISLELLGSLTAKPGQPDLSALNNVKIQVNEWKQENSTTGSLKGEIIYSKGTIPFEAMMTEAQTVFKFEGGSKPLVIDQNKALTGLIPNIDALPIDIGSFGNPQKLIEAVLPFLVKHLPNPTKISVDSVTETINNESLSLQKIHTEIKGTEFVGLVKQLVTNLLGDEDGLQALISELYKMIVPQASTAPAGGFDFSSVIVGYVVTMLKDSLPPMIAKLEASGDGTQLWSDKTYLNVDVYIDKELNIRKAAAEVMIASPSKDMPELQGIKVKLDMSTWNLNKSIKANTISSTDALIQGPDLKMGHFIKSLDANSKLYDLLMNQLHVTSKSLGMKMTADGTTGGVPGTPYIKDGFTMVPVRYISENLNADVSWNGDLRQVTIVEILSGKTILLTLDSNIAYVDGAQTELEVAAELTDELTYVPIRFIAENLGGVVGWDEITRTVSIVKAK